jgi:putative ABC transport system permease protein
MYLGQALKMAFKNILSNKLKTLLTITGVVVGIVAVMLGISFTLSVTEVTVSQFEGIGEGAKSIRLETFESSNKNLTYLDLKNFSDDNPNTVVAVAPMLQAQPKIKYLTKSTNTRLLGTSPEYQFMNHNKVVSGRIMLPFDIEYRHRVALVGSYIVKDLFEGMNPLGQDIKINGANFTVIGVLEEKAGGKKRSDDDIIVIPFTVAQRLMKIPRVSSFVIQAVDSKAVIEVEKKLMALLSTIYKDPYSYYIMTELSMLKEIATVRLILMGLTVGIASIILMVGGIGIMNIMLVSVTERTREIGIRKAIGATKRDILIQFLIEAVTITSIGGILGMVIGFVIIKLGFPILGSILAQQFGGELPVVFSIPWMLLPFGFSIMTGIIFGIFPAYKASKLKPIEALRFE